MRKEAIFLNGVFADVLRRIAEVQMHLPEQILYLQPYSSDRIVKLAENPPSVEDSVRLFASVEDDLAVVHYTGEIVGWDDKDKLDGTRLEILDRIIRLLQPGEGGVYMEARGIECKNLLHVRRLNKLRKPFSVGQLILASKGRPHSTGRATSGGWSYVVNPGDTWLEEYL